jgi:hypothetical protein
LGGGGGAGGEGGVAPEFSCDDLEPVGGAGGASPRECYDFSDPTADGDFTEEGGTWLVTNGAYVGVAPAAPIHCTANGTHMVASLLTGFTATDVRVHVKMTGLNRADKVLVLRAQDDENRIELNFRSNFGDPKPVFGGDLIVQEVVACDGSLLTEEGDVPVPHGPNDTLTVDVELRGRLLQVSVDGSSVFNAELAMLANVGPGGVGFATIAAGNAGSARFDDFIVESLD